MLPYIAYMDPMGWLFVKPPTLKKPPLSRRAHAWGGTFAPGEGPNLGAERECGGFSAGCQQWEVLKIVI